MKRQETVRQVLEQINTQLKEQLARLSDKIETYAVDSIDDYHAVATGKLRNAIHVRLDGDLQSGYQIICYAEGSHAPYAQYVHQGRKPGKMPPIAPLMQWAKKKMGSGGNPLFGGIGKGMVNRTRIRITGIGIRANKSDIKAFDEARRIAWGMAKNIEKYGIPEKPFFRDAVLRAIREN
ncbi:MAG: hypothetical protein Q8M98_07855 [Candidatus Cloacimonadaceae bacterium]|nr:hypothetical protein [Candidatus Cloacimonadaceae bacterium]